MKVNYLKKIRKRYSWKWMPYQMPDYKGHGRFRIMDHKKMVLISGINSTSDFASHIFLYNYGWFGWIVNDFYKAKIDRRQKRAEYYKAKNEQTV